MKVNFSNTEFYRELESSLGSSSGEKRKMWATTIIEKDIPIKNLAGLFKCEHKIASRFLWLLSDVGILNPAKLFNELPFLLDLCEHLKPGYKTSFASWWHYVGVPPENEAMAIGLLFQW